MKKTLLGATALVQVSDGEKSGYIKGDIKSTYSIGCNDTFLIIEEAKHKVDVFLNVANIVSITILKSKTYKEKEAKPEFEDLSIS